jgi:rhamnosyltransferase
MKGYRVAAYITAYEDPDGVKACVAAIRSQSFPVEQIFIVDNSSKQPICFEESLPIVVEHHPENLGISGALELGIRWAIAQGYDFFWTFDQDSQPSATCLETLINLYQELNQPGPPIGIIAPLPLDSNTQVEISGRIFDGSRFVVSPHADENVYECDVVITAGSLVAVGAAKSIESVNPDLFIDAVDWDFCLKFRQAGYRVLVVRSATMQHRFSDLEVAYLPVWKKEILINHYSPLRRYYICRNHTYVTIQICNLENLPKVIIHRLNCLLRALVKIWFYESDQKLLKSWACLLGTYDGFVGRLGKRW